MKKFCIFLLVVSLISILTSGCNIKQKPSNMVQSQRRFAQYVEPPKGNNGSVVDLSEGPKLNYDAKLGPQSLNFDIKIIDPY